MLHLIKLLMYLISCREEKRITNAHTYMKYMRIKHGNNSCMITKERRKMSLKTILTKPAPSSSSKSAAFAPESCAPT